ncbi:MAG TPA: DNA replication and repair protein RecF [Gaiellaceae bacterium]|nr:DNA replication and repair protein RecF [Gaiellaceae bacterium]
MVETLSLRDYRSYPRLELALQSGLVLAVGPNGAGKTNLLESLHVATQGFSPRTRSDAQLIRFGERGARVTVAGEHGGTPVAIEVALRTGEAKRARLNGAPLRAAEELRSRLPTLVFTPDRLAIVKGAPAVRRAYFDRALGRLFPSRAQVATDYAAALAQRNGALRRVAAGYSPRDALEPWTQQVADRARVLVAARRELVKLLSPEFSTCAAEFRLADAQLRYEGEPVSAEALDARLDQDLARGFTGLGPHLHDIAVVAGDRDLRSFGSQGEQRLAVLSLLLAEADLIAERGPAPPLLLLDDVLSELDPERRAILAHRIRRPGSQAVLTATSAAALPSEPDLLVRVSPGSAVAA